jgi:uncharacterized repeat protein (TIGR03843 family)
VAQGDGAQIRQMALFDAIINNTDRKYGHILPSTQGELFGCDHGVTFHEDPKLRTVLWQFAGKPFGQEEVAQLRKSVELADELFHGLITEEEIGALKARVESLLVGGSFPEPSEDWPSVPWPPF